jgi:predicted XRE-type DNA-binding protein
MFLLSIDCLEQRDYTLIQIGNICTQPETLFTQSEAAELLHITQPRVSDDVGRIHQYSSSDELFVIFS